MADSDPAARIDPLWVKGAEATRIRLEGGPTGTIRARLLALTLDVPAVEGLPDPGPTVVHVAIRDEHWPALVAAIASTQPSGDRPSG